MADVWKADQNVVALVYQRIDAAFPELIELKAGRIAVLMHEKASEKHGTVVYGTLKKAPSLLALLTDKAFKYDFVLSIAADRWQNNLDDAQRMAVIDHLLCGLTPKLNETTNEIKYEIRPPDVQMYLREVELHGIWWPDSQALEQMFAKWAGPAAQATPITRNVGIAPPIFAAKPAAASTASAIPGVRLPPKKGSKQTPRDKDGDLDGNDLDLPFVDDDGPSLTN
jgi:hypothetical protein